MRNGFRHASTGLYCTGHDEIAGQILVIIVTNIILCIVYYETLAHIYKGNGYCGFTINALRLYFGKQKSDFSSY